MACSEKGKFEPRRFHDGRARERIEPPVERRPRDVSCRALDAVGSPRNDAAASRPWPPARAYRATEYDARRSIDVMESFTMRRAHGCALCVCRVP